MNSSQSGSSKKDPKFQVITFHTSCKISFNLKFSRRDGIGMGQTHETRNAAGRIKEELTKSFRRIAAEATITASPSAGKGAALAISITCTLKNPMHDYVVRRSVSNVITMQSTFWLHDGKVKIQKVTADEVRQCYTSSPPANDGRWRWLHHSLLCSEAVEMPIAKFAEQLKLTVRNEEANFLACRTSEQFKNDAKSKQLLLHSVSEVLSIKFRDDDGGAQRVPQDTRATQQVVGTATVAVPPSMHTDSKSSTTLHATGAVHPTLTETVRATPQLGRVVGSEMITDSETAHLPAVSASMSLRRKLDYSADTSPGPAPSLNGNSCDAIPSSEEQSGTSIIATQFSSCFGRSKADLQFVAVAKHANRRHRKRGGKSH